jgi:hypothetical protein
MVSNLGKSRSPLVWYPMSRANLQDSANHNPIMVGIAEEPPRQALDQKPFDVGITLPVSNIGLPPLA